MPEHPRSLPALSGSRQTFEVEVKSVTTGEMWMVIVEASDPPSALAKVLRRKRFAEWLCSERPFRFVVRA
jgi:hypothetical protein